MTGRPVAARRTRRLSKGITGRGRYVAARRRGLRLDRRGGVYVEFLIAFLPVLFFFSSLLQLSLLFSARLVVGHAAAVGARAAAVIVGDEPGPYGETTNETNVLTGKRQQAVRDAVLVALAPLVIDGSLRGVRVRLADGSGTELTAGRTLGPMTPTGVEMLRVELAAELACNVPLASFFICSDGAGTPRTIRAGAEASYPYQGARYAY